MPINLADQRLLNRYAVEHQIYLLPSLQPVYPGVEGNRTVSNQVRNWFRVSLFWILSISRILPLIHLKTLLFQAVEYIVLKAPCE